MSKNYKIAVLPGDGTGPEVIAEAPSRQGAAPHFFPGTGKISENPASPGPAD